MRLGRLRLCHAGASVFTSDLSPAFWRAAAFVLGALWGSFFNVAIYRWPRELSVVNPPSHCPACKAPIPAWRNIPIFGFLFLRGRAACCGAKLSPRYFVVELLAAVLAVALAERFIVGAPMGTDVFDAGAEWLAWFVLIGALLIATFVDLEWMEIPDEVSLPGTAVGLATVSWRADPGPLECALGAGLGFLLVQVLFVWLYERVLGRRGMGEGDSKLLMMIGAFLGWRGVVFALVAGSVQGTLVAIGLLASGKTTTPRRPDEPEVEGAPSTDDGPGAPGATAERGPPMSAPQAGVGKMKLPYGPFLALGALEWLFFGELLTERYLEWMMFDGG